MTRYVPVLVDRAKLPGTAAWQPLLPPDVDTVEAPVIAWRTDDGGNAWLHAGASDREAITARALETVTEIEFEVDSFDEASMMVALTGTRRATECLLDRDLLRELHRVHDAPALLTGAPRRGRLLVYGMTGGMSGVDAFMRRVSGEYARAIAEERISPVAMLVRDGEVRGAINQLALAALYRPEGERV